MVTGSSDQQVLIKAQVPQQCVLHIQNARHNEMLIIQVPETRTEATADKTTRILPNV